MDSVTPRPSTLTRSVSVIPLIFSACLNIFTALAFLAGYVALRYVALRQEARVTRDMLDARAQIQITLVRAVGEARGFTSDERDMVRRLWPQAGYSDIAPVPE